MMPQPDPTPALDKEQIQMRCSRRRFLAAALLAAGAPAWAQERYPARPVRFVVPYPPGGASDVTARILADKLTEAWGQQVIVDNRPGANGIVALEVFVKQPPDGHTLLIANLGPNAINPAVYPKLPYDPIRDFAPVTLLTEVPQVLVAYPGLEAKTLPELLALAKAKPGGIVYGTGGNGSANHLAIELMASIAGISMTSVAYRGDAQAMTDTMSGQIALTMPTVVAAMPHVKSGKLRPLAVSTRRRVESLPEVPTMDESGVPGFESASWGGVMAPAGTQRTIVDTVHSQLARILQLPDVRQKLGGLGGHDHRHRAQRVRIVPAGGNPQVGCSREKSEHPDRMTQRPIAAEATQSLPSLSQLQAARAVVLAAMPPTPQYAWPLLARRLGAEVWLKHENHTPVGAFKLRGGLAYLSRIAGDRQGLIAATRGNHGQSIAYAAARHRLPVMIVVPHGNSREKNAAMRALGAQLVEHGEDFQASLEFAQRLAGERGLRMVPSFDPMLVCGVASCWLELFEAVPDLDLVFVPIGLGSGACAAAAARTALGRRMRLIGVVSDAAPTYALSLQAGHPVPAPVTTELADGLACRVPNADALRILQRELDGVVQVSDAEIAQAMKILYVDTHNVAEGAGAASLAAALRMRREQPGAFDGRRIGLTLTGGNVDHERFARVLLETAID
ncbi:MAG TPA: threonine dehydratase [Burkholderiaceae bacterium]|nr:threonine dehydratase [Burkholderiaceae bacterium]